MFIYAPGLVPRRISRNFTQHDEYLKAHKGIDVALIAFNLKVTERWVCQRQRKLGLRSCRNTLRKGERDEQDL